jgi:hypothetical protein
MGQETIQQILMVELINYRTQSYRAKNIVCFFISNRKVHPKKSEARNVELIYSFLAKLVFIALAPVPQKCHLKTNIKPFLGHGIRD